MIIDWDKVETFEQKNEKRRQAKLIGFRSAIQSHLDSVAQSYGYDGIATAVTYAEEPSVPKFQAEGQAFRAWRSVVWDYSYAELAKFDAGLRPEPSIEEFILELPVLEIQG